MKIVFFWSFRFVPICSVSFHLSRHFHYTYLAAFHAPRHLAAGARKIHPARLRLRCRGALLAPFAVEPLLKVADSRLRKLQLLFERGSPHNGPVVLALPVAAIPFKLDVLLLGQ